MVQKKGVSPLIATVLLVMIVVSLGAAIWVLIDNLMTGYEQEVAGQEIVRTCGSQVTTKVYTLSNKYRMCYNVTNITSGNVALYIENNGVENIIGFKVDILGADGLNSTTYSSSNATLNKGETKGFKFNFGGIGTNSTTVAKIRINPRILGAAGKDTVTCNEPIVEFEAETLANIDDCSSVTWDNGVTVISS